MNILLVGCGKMGGALVQRWQALKICRELVIVDPSMGSSEAPVGFKPDVVVFAVKPQTIADIIGNYKSFVAQGALVVSVITGKSLSFFEKHLGGNAKVVRTMPNTPSAIGKGVTVAIANKHASGAEKEKAAVLLGAVGEVLWVEKESLLDPVTALSGSGPAYVFLLIEVMTKAGIHLGLDPAMAEKLARQTVIGSAALAEASADTPAAKLRENVTSPNGTTQAALDVLMRHPGMQEIFDQALSAAAKRAEELSG